MPRYTTSILLLSVLVALVLPSVARGTPWNLPSSRVAAAAGGGSPPLLRHDFSLSLSSSTSRRPSSLSAQFGLLPAVVGLKGGETKPTEQEDDDDLGQLAPKTAPQTAADEIARGGGATALKREETEIQQPHFVAQREIAISNSTLTTSSHTSNTLAWGNQTTTTTSKSLATKPKKEKFHKRIAKKLKNRNATNLRRKVMHASFGLFFAALNHFIPKETFVPGMAVLSSATLLMELLRYRKHFGWMNHALHFVLGGALRKHEMDGKFTGSFYFFTGVTLTAALFPTSCATMGIIQLAIADPSASYFGRATRHIYWSRIENGLGGFGRNKGFLGFLGGALFCVPFNYRILSIAKFGAEGMPGGRASLALASLALGVAGAFADLAVPTPALTMPNKIWGVKVPPLHLDDNFVVPVVSGYACTQVFKALGWQQNLELARFLFV